MLLVLSLISVAARAQERKPARPLPAERADILLMESRDKFEKPRSIGVLRNLAGAFQFSGDEISP